jgi:hypothetical protein
MYDGVERETSTGVEGRRPTADALPRSVHETSPVPRRRSSDVLRAPAPPTKGWFMAPTTTCAHIDVATTLQSLIREREVSPPDVEPEPPVPTCDADPEVIVSTSDGKLAYCHVHLRDAADAMARDRARAVAATPA